MRKLILTQRTDPINGGYMPSQKMNAFPSFVFSILIYEEVGLKSFSQAYMVVSVCFVYVYTRKSIIWITPKSGGNPNA